MNTMLLLCPAQNAENIFSIPLQPFLVHFTYNRDIVGDLCALIIVTYTESTLSADSVSPEATEINAALRELGMSEEEPETEDWLRQDIEDSVGQNFLVDAKDAGSVGYTPNDWVGGPDEDCVKRNGSIEFANFASLGLRCETPVVNKVPDDDEEANASNCIPSPLVTLGATICSE